MGPSRGPSLVKMKLLMLAMGLEAIGLDLEGRLDLANDHHKELDHRLEKLNQPDRM